MLIWKTNTSSARTASYRYRCLFPAQHLAKLGYPSVIYGRAERVYCSPQATALVFMKSFTNEDVDTCRTAVNKGIPVILDLCDNIFIDEYAEGRNLDYSPRENFWAMATMSSAVVTTGPALQQAVKDFVANPPPVWVIPDGCETLEDVHHALAMGDWQRRLDILRYSPRGFGSVLESQAGRFIKSLTRSLKRQRSRILRLVGRVRGIWYAVLANGKNPSTISYPAAPDAPGLAISTPDIANGDGPSSSEARKTVLWFGNHGTSYGQVGMENILEVSPALHDLNSSIPLRLRIVSNSYDKYLKLIEPLPFPTEYTEWHPTGVYHHIATSDVVIIPNSKSPFSICKSANRAILALSMGVPVVATATPALQPFHGCIMVDDWGSGLQQYLSQPDLVERHIQQAQAMIESTYGGTAIARQWIHLLNKLQRHRHGQP